MMSNPIVGFFDSGIGGECILDAFHSLCPEAPTRYLGDSANCPYGNRPVEEIVELSEANVRKLLAQGCSMIVIACNTATAAAIDYLRNKYPEIPFVGVEPAVKPAALKSKSGIVAVLATQGTFNGRLYRETSERFAKGVTVIATVADEFVTIVEQGGDLASAEVEKVVRSKLEPLVAAGADYIVLGCTHFPHLRVVMEKVVAGRATLIDPSIAVAQRAKTVWEALCQK